MSATGILRYWHVEAGWGVIDSVDTPGGCWVHVNDFCDDLGDVVPGEDVIVFNKLLEAYGGDLVEFQWKRACQIGWDYLATSARLRDRTPPHRVIRHVKRPDPQRVSS